jgi:hypothetical protein
VRGLPVVIVQFALRKRPRIGSVAAAGESRSAPVGKTGPAVTASTIRRRDFQKLVLQTVLGALYVRL